MYYFNISLDGIGVLFLFIFPFRQPSQLTVVWQRRTRRVETSVPSWEPSMRNPLEGICVWPVPANLSITVTLFRDQRSDEFEDKEWTLIIEDVSISFLPHKVCTKSLYIKV